MKIIPLALALILGILLPYGHPLTFLVRYSVMIMLFFAFLGMHVNRNLFRRSHVYLGIIFLILPLLYFGLIRIWDASLALIAYVMATTPTAAAAPVITDYLKGRVEFVTLSILITSGISAFAIPFFLPLLGQAQGDLQVLDILRPVMITLGIPLLLAFGVRRFSPLLKQQLLKVKDISFYLFLFNVYVAMSKATHFILHESGATMAEILGIAGVTLLVAAGSFFIGHHASQSRDRLEGSMSLGRKNTMFALWVALTFVGPLAALGPMFYIVWQNIYNSWQLYVVGKKEKAPP